jgi:hypothetical protein
MCGYSTVGEGDVWGWSKGLSGVLKIGQLILSMGPVGAEVGILALRATYPKKEVFCILLNHHTCCKYVFCYSYFSLLQVKNKTCDGDT